MKLHRDRSGFPARPRLGAKPTKPVDETSKWPRQAVAGTSEAGADIANEQVHGAQSRLAHPMKSWSPLVGSRSPGDGFANKKRPHMRSTTECRLVRLWPQV